MNWKTLLWSIIPFGMGLLVGGGLTRNKWVWLILVFYIIFTMFLTLFKDKIIKYKESTDKRVYASKMKDEVLSDTYGYIGEGYSKGYRLFDTVFPGISMLIGIFLVGVSVYLLFLRDYFNSYLSIFMVIIYIVLVNIYRNTKNKPTEG